MNKILLIILVVVLSACSNHPTAPSTTETMLFNCSGIPHTVDIKHKEIISYGKKYGFAFTLGNPTAASTAYRYDWDHKTERLNYRLTLESGNEVIWRAMWVQNADGDFIYFNFGIDTRGTSVSNAKGRWLQCERIKRTDFEELLNMRRKSVTDYRIIKNN